MTDAPTADAADAPRLYLVTPPEFELSDFPDRLAACLDRVETACVRIALATHDEDRLGRAADALREVTEARDVPIVLDRHVALAQRHGMDGVHLVDGARSVKAARKTLGEDGIVGAFCGASRHDGLTAGEMGADYVSFGPAGASALGTGERAPAELFEWWSQMVEVPLVAEGALDAEVLRLLAPFADFIALGEEIWREDDPAAAYRRMADLLG